ANTATASRFTGIKIKRNLVENPFLRVKFYPDGSFDLFDKIGKRQFKRCHIFEDTEDIGDAYDYAPAKRRQIVSSRGKKGTLRLVHKSPVAAEFEVRMSLSLPAAFDRDRRRRSNKTVRCPLTIRFTITATAPYLSIHTTFHNSAHDHRLRVQFTSPIATTTSLAGQQFFVIERPLKKTPGKNWRQPPSPTEPMQHFCAIGDRKGGLAILVQGLYEYEARREGRGTALLLTLLRSVGWLSRDDLATRPGHAGPFLPTPEAQCLGRQEFRYAIMPYTGNWQKADLPLAAQQFRTPLLSKLCLGPGGALPADFSLFHIEPKSIVVTAIKKSEQRDTIIVRLFNASALRFKGKLSWGLPVARAWKLSLLEERLEETTVFSNSRIDIDFPAWRIVTLELEMSKSVLAMSP
ncbi:MAG: glycosyl hydrolase-related protein, partial [candidate division KSB1 bacterium]|nr:glycosyl hydrolase-related protein [candidate division KSB1 bacterium]